MPGIRSSGEIIQRGPESRSLELRRSVQPRGGRAPSRAPRSSTTGVRGCSAVKDFLTASAVLYRAARLAPDRADVLLLLAHATEELGYYEDTASTLEKYLKLRPADEVAHRELGFSLILQGKFDEGL